MSEFPAKARVIINGVVAAEERFNREIWEHRLLFGGDDGSTTPSDWQPGTAPVVGLREFSTGEYDSNDNEIYEGDRVDDGDRNGVVVWDDVFLHWAVRFEDSSHQSLYLAKNTSYNLTVIGRHESEEITDEDCLAAMVEADADQPVKMPPKSRRTVTVRVTDRRKGEPSGHEEAE